MTEKYYSKASNNSVRNRSISIKVKDRLTYEEVSKGIKRVEQ